MKQQVIRVREDTCFMQGYQYLSSEYYGRKISTSQEIKSTVVSRVHSTPEPAEVISTSDNRWKRFGMCLSAIFLTFSVLVQ